MSSFPETLSDGMGRAGGALDQAAGRLERAESVDGLSATVRKAVEHLLPAGPIRDAASGVVLGHPAHPMLVAGPIGLWAGALVLDLQGRHPAAAKALVGAGVLAALPTALTGWSDWLDTDGAEQRIGLAHASLNAAAIGSFAVSWWRRRRGSSGKLAAAVGASALAGAGWLGGHLAYSMGVGVDTNAFEAGPTDWTEVPGFEGLEAGLRGGEAGGVRLVAVGGNNGQVAVLADRCSHRGGPLSEGRLVSGCVECPWHGSRFEARSGRVVRGPATVPQPAYQARAVPTGDDDGRAVEVRRPEARALRRNSVRA